MPVRQIERHRAGRTGWLRAAVLGANDGLLSTASLVMGVAAAHGSRSNVLIAGFASLVAGAMSMAAGEYVSVHSQKDTEDADIALERRELRTNDEGEHEELAAIYVGRGLDPALAKTVADQLMAHDALGAHARDELGITLTLEDRPIQAALASAESFMFGAAMPLIVTALVPEASLLFAVPAASLLVLACLGALAARTGGAKMARPARYAMGVTAAAGALFGTRDRISFRSAPAPSAPPPAHVARRAGSRQSPVPLAAGLPPATPRHRRVAKRGRLPRQGQTSAENVQAVAGPGP